MAQKSTIKVIPKRRGRPATGKDPLISLRVPPELKKAIEDWAKREKIKRSEAIRRFVEEGLQRGKR
jgi:hypothetical protein